MAAEAALPPLESLIRPEQIHQIAAIAANEKDKYFAGVKGIWDVLNTLAPDDPEYIKQHKKLVSVTEYIRTLIKKQKAAGAGRPPGSEQFSESVMAQVKKLNVVASPQLWSKPEEARANVTDQRLKYAQQCQRLESVQGQLQQVGRQIAARNESGKPLTPEENNLAANRRAGLDKLIRESREWMFGFEAQQERWKAQQQQMNNDASNARSTQPSSNTGQASSSNPQPNLDNAANPSNPMTDAAAVGDAGKGQNLQSRPPVASSTTISAGPPPTTQNFAFPPQASTAVAPLAGVASSLNPNVPTANPQQYQAPHQQAGSQVPQPLSQKAAIAQANRSYSTGGSQPLQPRANSQSSGHPTPSMNQSEPQTKNPPLPIPPKLSVSPLQPVQMGSARPTLSGGPSTGAAGPMGQPGIQKHPYYVLEGEGERVLSKKKLEELVRQVTGGSDGEAGESLEPDVEETLLDIADEFVDNVITAACRLAKTRLSATLELRDIQLILERNYNIRVPGYASDELRTVKKILPTPAWTQKMSAVQAAKVTGGKPDI